MTQQKKPPAKPADPGPDPADGMAKSAPEATAADDDYVPPEDMPADAKITPPAVQTGAVPSPVVGEPLNPDDPGVQESDKNKADGTGGNPGNVVPKGG